MSVQERRNKLLEQFQMIIQDEQNMGQLEIMLNGILNQGQSVLTEDEWKEMDRRSADYKSGKVLGSSWEDVKARIRSKHAI